MNPPTKFCALWTKAKDHHSREEKKQISPCVPFESLKSHKNFQDICLASNFKQENNKGAKE